jgi:UDP-glucose 4-epimerase
MARSRSMAILVTGGAGYVDSHLVAALVEAGEKTVVLDDLSGGSRKAVHPNATLIVGDIGDRTLVRRVLTENAVEAVIHLAAKVVVAAKIDRIQTTSKKVAKA